MTRSKTLFIVLVALVIGFGVGFVLRPVIMPVERAPALASPAPAAFSVRGFSRREKRERSVTFG